MWFTLEGGVLSDVYYPDLSTPSTRELQLVVTDGKTFTTTERAGTTHETVLADRRSLTYRQVNTDRDGRWRVTKTYVTDPNRSTVLVHVTFTSLTGKPYRVFVQHDPDLTNNGDDDSARTAGDALVAGDGHTASALVAADGFGRRSNGFRDTSGGLTDLREDHRLDHHYESARDGNVVQTARTPLNGVGHTELTLALGFGGTGEQALATARKSLAAGFDTAAGGYARGWHEYLDSLDDKPTSLGTETQRRAYLVSAMALAASEDKTYPGAFIASPSMPWAWAFNDELAGPTGPYHLAWPRDQYQVATALLALGDRAAATRALEYMWKYQQQPDGHLSQNTKVDGTPYWTSIQLDETADPIILAWQLGHDDEQSWQHVRKAAEFILNFGKDGHQAPWTEQERWEEQSGYSPATVATEIAALVCAAEIAEANGAGEAARRYLDTADTWQRKVDGWTVTSTGPHSDEPYYLRLTKDGRPDRGTTYDLGNSGRTGVDQREVVDPSFLELVRLGVKRADDPTIVNTVRVVDEQLSVKTPNGRFWHRYSEDGYGEQRDGGPWNIGFEPGSRTTIGRLWPLLTGERAEYELAAGNSAEGRLATMARVMNSGGMMPEQVWGDQSPSGKSGYRPGEGTFAATPLLWTHAQYVRLARSIDAGEPVERPQVVARRYASGRGQG